MKSSDITSSMFMKTPEHQAVYGSYSKDKVPVAIIGTSYGKMRFLNLDTGLDFIGGYKLLSQSASIYSPCVVTEIDKNPVAVFSGGYHLHSFDLSKGELYCKPYRVGDLDGMSSPAVVQIDDTPVAVCLGSKELHFVNIKEGKPYSSPYPMGYVYTYSSPAIGIVDDTPIAVIGDRKSVHFINILDGKKYHEDYPKKFECKSSSPTISSMDGNQIVIIGENYGKDDVSYLHFIDLETGKKYREPYPLLGEVSSAPAVTQVDDKLIGVLNTTSMNKGDYTYFIDILKGKELNKKIKNFSGLSEIIIKKVDNIPIAIISDNMANNTRFINILNGKDHYEPYEGASGVSTVAKLHEHDVLIVEGENPIHTFNDNALHVVDLHTGENLLRFNNVGEVIYSIVVAYLPKTKANQSITYFPEPPAH